MKPHPTHPGWLVDDRGHTWRREQVFGCPEHPYGPPHEDEPGDEHVAAAALARGLWNTLGTAAAISTVTGCTREQVDAAHTELGLCCAGHRWTNTGRLIEVSSFEEFIYTHMPRRVSMFRESLGGEILLKELEGTDSYPGGDRIRIPLIVDAGTPLPLSAAAEAARGYKLDPSIPPTVE